MLKRGRDSKCTLGEIDDASDLTLPMKSTSDSHKPEPMRVSSVTDTRQICYLGVSQHGGSAQSVVGWEAVFRDLDPFNHRSELTYRKKFKPKIQALLIFAGSGGKRVSAAARLLERSQRTGLAHFAGGVAVLRDLFAGLLVRQPPPLIRVFAI